MKETKGRIYLDHAATTPLDPEVRTGMERVAEAFGNPSSVHAEGRRARQVLDEARERLAALLKARPKEVVFTSGGSEADALALIGTALARGRGHLVSTQVEHSAVLESLKLLQKLGFEVTLLPPDRFGLVYPEQVAEALRPDTILVSVMAANNEIGTLYPVEEIARLCRERGVVFHTDFVQAATELSVPEGPHLLSLSAHKFYGPKGVGALLVRGVELFPLIPGRQERGLRGGTPNPALAYGMALALEKARREDLSRILRLRQALEEGLLAVEGVELNGHPKRRLAKLVNVTVRGADGEALLMAMDLLGVAVSSGSACSAGSLEPSHVLLAIGRTREEARASLRFSLGRYTTLEEVKEAVNRFRQAVEMARL
ncbi:cysteine desulfurase [Thermus filiformis]|uniref:Cysteine desulfurase n=1 Tax=Thermus filiformis TaxID=276 RepID=A0A0A2WS52_THEFI|nr:cysteine desulfurase [Thermus filiformis]